MIDTAQFPYPVLLTWARNPEWNRICVWALEHMGLPGGSYCTRPHEDYMQWNFATEQDQLMFTLAWGDDHEH